MQKLKQAKIIQSERAIVIEYDDEVIAAQMFDSFIAKVNGDEIPNDWVGLSEEVEILDWDRRTLSRKIEKCERERAAGSKPERKLGKHYRRKNGSTPWEVFMKAIKN